jgi:BRCA1-associated protein
VSDYHNKNPELPVKCSKCDKTNNVWVCLICGNLGCGRYDSRHAQDHSVKENHRFSM